MNRTAPMTRCLRGDQRRLQSFKQKVDEREIAQMSGGLSIVGTQGSYWVNQPFFPQRRKVRRLLLIWRSWYRVTAVKGGVFVLGRPPVDSGQGCHSVAPGRGHSSPTDRPGSAAPLGAAPTRSGRSPLNRLPTFLPALGNRSLADKQQPLPLHKALPHVSLVSQQALIRRNFCQYKSSIKAENGSTVNFS